MKWFPLSHPPHSKEPLKAPSPPAIVARLRRGAVGRDVGAAGRRWEDVSVVQVAATRANTALLESSSAGSHRKIHTVLKLSGLCILKLMLKYATSIS